MARLTKRIFATGMATLASRFNKDLDPVVQAIYAEALSGLTAEDRNLGTIAHLTPLVLMIVSGGVAGFIGSLVVSLYAKDRGPAARRYAAGALNVQIGVSIAAAISWLLVIVLVGFITLQLVILFGIVVHVARHGSLRRVPRGDPRTGVIGR